MKQVNLFTANLEGKALRTEKSESKKAVNAALANFEAAINGAFTAVIKDTDRRARNVANAAKGRYGTALQVVAHCFPYQTATGALARKAKDEAGDYRWAEKKLTAAAARGIVRDALRHFTDTVGQPSPVIVVIGQLADATKATTEAAATAAEQAKKLTAAATAAATATKRAATKRAAKASKPATAAATAAKATNEGRAAALANGERLRKAAAAATAKLEATTEALIHV